MKLLVLLFTAHLLAADDTGFLVWKSPELKGYEQTLHSKLGPDRTANLRLKDINGHPVVVVHREATAPAEFHETYSHLIYVISGEATLVAGGELTGKQTSTPDPIPGTVTLHAESVTGGESREIAAGGHDSDSTQGTTLVQGGPWETDHLSNADPRVEVEGTAKIFFTRIAAQRFNSGIVQSEV